MDMRKLFVLLLGLVSMHGAAQTTPVDSLTANHPEYLPALQIGQQAPDFSAPDTLGRVIKLSDYRGKYLVLDFWASWCGDCRREIPALKKLFAEHRNTYIHGCKLEWLSLSFDNKAEAWKNVLRREHFEWPQVSNLKNTREDPVFKAFQLRWIPAFFILSPEGQVVAKAITADGLRRELEMMMPEPRKRDHTWTMVWHDEFDGTGPFDETKWTSEEGFRRNEEDQWYQAANSNRENGLLVIEAKLDSIPNPRYNPQSKNVFEQRPYAKYSSGSINTRGKYTFLYGQMEVRARIPAVMGAWPAIWTLGVKHPWPSCGEIDIMEYYQYKGVPTVLANAAWGGEKPHVASWNSTYTPYNHFLEKDPFWGEKFHVWLMDWSEDFLRIYLDGELLNNIDIREIKNGSLGNFENPFRNPQYILLNLAIGGHHGGTLQHDAFPMRYEVDYVRVWQQK